ncbi:MAG: translocation/assembly module TamB domain-containing protein [Bacteroidales bacterium]
MKKKRHIWIYLLAIVGKIVLVAFIVFKSPPIQTLLTRYIAKKISEKVKARIEIGAVDFSIFKTFVLHDVYVEDLQKDTLFFIRHIEVNLSDFDGTNKIIKARNVNLSQPQCFLKQSKQGELNLQFLIDVLSSDTTDTTPSKPFKFYIDMFRISNGKFKFDNLAKPKLKKDAVDFDHLNIKYLNVDMKDIAIIDDSIVFNIRKISLKENSGLQLSKLKTKGYIAASGIHLKNLYIETSNSLIHASHFKLKTKSLKDFNDFDQRVKFDIAFCVSKVCSEDIAYFAPILHGLKQNVVISGKVKGPLVSLKTKDFLIKYNKNTYIKGDYEINGLPDIDNSFMILKFDYLKTNASDFAHFPLPPFDGSNTLELPILLNTLGNIFYKGELSGFVNDFVAYGKLKTDLGSIKSDAKIKYDTSKNQTLIKGNVALTNFFIGKVINANPLVGYVTMNASVDALIKKDGFNAKLNGLFQSLDFNHYTYKDIKVDGILNEKMFDGSLKLYDPNINLDFLGKIDYSTKEPVFSFMADVKHAKLNELHFLPRDSNIELSFLLDSKIKGDNIDNMNGSIDIYQLKYKHNSIYSESNTVQLSLKQDLMQKNILLKSDFVNMSLMGKFQFNDFLYYIQEELKPYMPSLSFVNKPKHFKAEEDFNIHADLKLMNYKGFIRDFLPWLFIADNSTINVDIDKTEHLKIKLFSDSVNISGLSITDLQFKMEVQNEKLLTEWTGSKFYLNKQIALNKPIVKIYTSNNTNEVSLLWDRNDSLVGDGEIAANVNMFFEDKKFKANIVFNPSRINFNQLEWYLNDGTININDSIISIKQAIINQDEQYFYVDGRLGNTMEDSLIININQLQLSLFNPLIKSSGLTFEGVMNGYLLIRSTLHKPLLISDFTIHHLKLNNEDLGDFKIKGQWNDEKQKLFYLANAYRGTINTLHVVGDYDEQNKINADIRLDKLRLNVIEPFVSSFASDVRGTVSGMIHFSGTFKEPQLEGNIRLTKAAFMINYLNTRYNFTGDVQVFPNLFKISGIDLYDEEGNVALMSGTVNHNYFKNINVDLLLNSKRFLFLNTKHSDNNLFYGSVYTSGLVNIIGSLNNIAIIANVQTEKGTMFNLNLESETELSQQNFIYFVNSNKTINKKDQPIVTSSNLGLTLNLNIQATPDAIIQLIFDSKAGDILKSQGTGNLRLELKPSGDFLIFGNYIISQGDYLFTLQNVINKKFNVLQGSTISFSGDPLNADIDIKAVYKLRTSLYDLMLDSTYKARVPVECELNLKNKLLNPTFNFAIKVPNSDSRVEGVISGLSDEEINKQVISLLVLNRFVTPETFKSGVKTIEYSNTNAVGVNSSEFLTNQLNHWLSQISKTVNLGINYRPGDMITNEELELALSTQIFNDRVTISTNLGVSNSSQTESSMLIGDFDVELKLSKSGKLKAKGFNRTNTTILKDTSPYTQGVGLFYREEFDNWNDILRNYWKSVFARKKKDDQTLH